MTKDALPRITLQDGCWQFMVNDNPSLLLAGEPRNSSSSDPTYMETVWPRMRAMNLNTVIATVSWELIEPTEGVFDFSSVKHLLTGARKHGLKLILIWFGTWKNGLSTYVPAWVKRDTARYFRCLDLAGHITRTISPLCDECVAADAKAFSHLMAFLRDNDGQEQTVVAVQVENEAGIYGCGMDHSPAATAAFMGDIPDALAKSLGCSKGIWREALGDAAEEAFMSWCFARAVNKVAEAGKAVYALPMFVNTWTKQYANEPAGFYPTGGPIAEMYDVWKVAAPAIDAFGADAYQLNIRDEFHKYMQNGRNPLMLPELRFDRWAAPSILYAIGCGALLTSIFAIDDLGHWHTPTAGAVIQGVFDTFSVHDPTESITALYAELRGMEALLLQARRDGRVQCLLQNALITEGLDAGGYHLRVTYAHTLESMQCPGVLLVIDEGGGSALLMGVNVRVELATSRQAYADILSIDEGTFKDGTWRRLRRLNGDEQRISFGEKVSVLRCTFYGIDK